MIFGVAEYEFGVKIKKFKTVSPKWWSYNLKERQNLFNFFGFRNTGIFRVAECDSEIKIFKF